MPSSRREIRFSDILENIALIEAYVADLDYEVFARDRRTRDAVERCLQRISEAAVKPGALAEQLAPDPPWSSVRALGNVLRHAYDQIDPSRVWEIVARDLPALKADVEAAVERLKLSGKS